MNSSSSFESGLTEVATPPVFKDRSTALLVFGILEIFVGALTALFIPILILGTVLSHKHSGGHQAPKYFVMNLVTLAIAAPTLLTLGIGVTQAKRWARAMNMALSWIWVSMGTLLTIVMIALLPTRIMAKMQSTQTANGSTVSAGVMAGIVTFMIVFMALFLVVLPLTFVLFYRSKNIEETFKHRDPVERWTDRIPLPVVIWILLASVGVEYNVVFSFMTPIFPFFGKYLMGFPAAGLFLIFGVIDAYVAFSFFHLRLTGWWVAVITMIFRISAVASSLGRANPLDAYSKTGLSSDQIERMHANPMFRNNSILWWGVAFMLIYLVFLLSLKRYFGLASKSGIGQPLADHGQPSQLG